MQHHFKEMPGEMDVNKDKIFVKRWHCKQCDSIVEFPISVNEFDVNQKMANVKGFPCLEPIAASN